jgi:SAM-dependent methyltransferase
LHPDAERWNARYRSEMRFYLQREPYNLVTANSDLLPTQGFALDAAAGVSPLAGYLAQRGLSVLALDISLDALLAARQRVTTGVSRVSCAVVDLTNPWLPSDYFDVIFNFYFLSRPLLDRYMVALKPGGLLFFETFLWTDRPGSNPLNYAQAGEIERKFASWEIRFKNEFWKQGRDGNANHRKALQLIAQKPVQ